MIASQSSLQRAIYLRAERSHFQKCTCTTGRLRCYAAYSHRKASRRDWMQESLMMRRQSKLMSSKLTQAEVGKEQEDQTVWIRSTGTLFLGGFGTNMLLALLSDRVSSCGLLRPACARWHSSHITSILVLLWTLYYLQVLSLESWQVGFILLATDMFFVATSYKFLDLAEAFDRDWHVKRQPYPGEIIFAQARYHRA